MVGITIVAVVLMGAPLAYVLNQLADNAARNRLERQAAALALGVEDELSAGKLPTSQAMRRLTPAGDHTVVVLEGVGTVDGGEPIAGRALSAEIRVAPDATVEVQAPAKPVDDQVQRALLILVALAVVGTSVAAALAVVQGRRLARPLEALARTSQRLGRGDFSATAPRSGVSEIDDVAEALDASSARIARLVQAEREFSANASHQLRSALTGVSLHLEAISEHDDPDVRLEAHETLKQIDRLTEVTDELLRLARVGRSGERREVDLAALVSEHVADWRARFTRARRRLLFQAPARTLVTVTPGAVGQALDILLSNALEHGAGSTAVRVAAHPVDAHIVVADEGPGIAPDARSHPFDRAETADGHGLGLTLARQLITADGGSLELIGPATFRIRVPFSSIGAEPNGGRTET